MNHHRLIRVQLTIFALVTVLSMSAVAVFYLRLPAVLGVGAYTVTAEFAVSGGLYPNANVTYRGVTVGNVQSVGLTHGGVEAVLRLDNPTAIPADVVATVHSMSAIGEQYLDLVPGQVDGSGVLHDGSRIGRAQTRVSQDVASLLREADRLVSSISDSRLQDLLRESFAAFNGAGPDLARLLQGARRLVDEANNSWPQTSKLIDQAGPFLDAQIRSGEDIRQLTDGFARFSDELGQADGEFSSLLAATPDAADQVGKTFAGVRPTFPLLAANLANLGRVGVIYNKSLEQILVLMPALFAAILTIGGAQPGDEGANVDFKLNLGDTPPCLTGFIPPPLTRTPADETLRELPTDLYCKVAQDDPTNVRGARNYPCQEFPGKRAPTVALCRDPRGYVPLGSNPWRGPPVPYSTPVRDPRNILPPNKFPYLPPGSVADPGALSPPAPSPPLDHSPAETPPLPAEQGGQVVPQGTDPPVAATDLADGGFTEPTGERGIFAPAMTGYHAAESWVDLMLDPSPR
jgi:phospholipid/cholesterol/gamma-HCH transport system substrate-binding protein